MTLCVHKPPEDGTSVSKNVEFDTYRELYFMI